MIYLRNTFFVFIAFWACNNPVQDDEEIIIFTPPEEILNCNLELVSPNNELIHLSDLIQFTWEVDCETDFVEMTVYDSTEVLYTTVIPNSGAHNVPNSKVNCTKCHWKLTVPEKDTSIEASFSVSRLPTSFYGEFEVLYRLREFIEYNNTLDTSYMTTVEIQYVDIDHISVILGNKTWLDLPPWVYAKNTQFSFSFDIFPKPIRISIDPVENEFIIVYLTELSPNTNGSYRGEEYIKE